MENKWATSNAGSEVALSVSYLLNTVERLS